VATGTALGTGQANTTGIAANKGAGIYAASICAAYSVTVGATTYNDWFLPSKDELNLMFLNKAIIDATAGANGGSSLADRYYWSSMELGYSYALVQYFVSGIQFVSTKASFGYFRAARAF